MPAPNPRRFDALSLQEAAEASPTLAGLVARVRASSAWLEAVRPMLPPPLRTAVRAGPIEDGQWCLLVQGSAAAAKLRQLLPLMETRLAQTAGQRVAIRIKVMGSR